MFCVNCGKKINHNEKFCPNCGAPVHLEESHETLLQYEGFAQNYMDGYSQAVKRNLNDKSISLGKKIKNHMELTKQIQNSGSYWVNLSTGGNFNLLNNLTSWLIVVGMAVNLLDIWFDWGIFSNAILVMSVIVVYIDYKMLKTRSELTGQKLTGAWMIWCVFLLPVYLWKKATKTSQSHAAAIVSIIITVLMVALCAYVWYCTMMLAIYD